MLGRRRRLIPVRVFGEMVSLWDAALIDAAIEVEAIWNELGAQYVLLFCAYPHSQPVDHPDALTEVWRPYAVTGPARGRLTRHAVVPIHAPHSS
jgi:hypothetical protein